MNDTAYQTIIINKNNIGSGRQFFAVGAISALMLIIFNIYFIYAAVDALHALETVKLHYQESEYAYQESARLYQEALQDIGKEIAVQGGFLRLGNSVFVSRSSSLVLR